MFASRTQKAYHSTWKRRFIFLDAIIFRGCVCVLYIFLSLFFMILPKDFQQTFGLNCPLISRLKTGYVISLGHVFPKL